MTEFRLTSPAFANGDTIPRQYGYTEANVNPPLEIHGVPNAAEALALVMDDPDAVEPAGKVWDHWILYDIDPQTTHIPEDWDGGNALEGTNDYGETGYGGPNPPDREHTYRFRLYALDTPVDIDAGASKVDLEAAMNGHIIASATLEGTYAP